MTTARDIFSRIARSVMAVGSGIARKVKSLTERLRRKLLSLWRARRVEHEPRDTFRRKLVRASMAMWMVCALGAGPAAAAVDSAFANWLRDCPADRTLAQAVAPSIVVVPVLDDSGYAPLHMIWRIDVAASSTGAGDWNETRIEWRFKVNGAVPTTRITCLDPHTGGTHYLDASQNGFNCNQLCLDAGTCSIEARMENVAGLRSAWTGPESSEPTCSPEAERPGWVYFDPNAAGAGTGLSWTDAKTTYATAAALLSTSADGWGMYCRAGNIANSTNVTGANKFITADPDAVGDVTLTFTAGVTGSISTTGTRGIVIGRGLKYDSASGIGKIHGHGTSITSYGACLWDLKFGYLEDISNGSGSGVSSSAIRGFSHINIVQDGTAFTGELFFANDCSDMLAFGVQCATGGSAEHTYRLAGGGIVGRVARYHSWLACDLGNLVKAAIREYSDGYVVIARSEIRRVMSIGGVSPDSQTTTGGSVFILDGCHIQQIEGQTEERYLVFNSGWTHITSRNCFYDDMAQHYLPRTNEGDPAPHYCNGHRFIHNTVFKGDAAIRINQMIEVPFDIKIRNNLFVHTGSMTSGETYIQVQNATTVTDFEISGNTYYNANATDNVFENTTTSISYDVSEFMAAFAYATNESRASGVTFDSETLEPNAGLTNGRSGEPHAFTSYNGVQYDYSASNYTSGAWLDPAAAGSYPDALGGWPVSIFLL